MAENEKRFTFTAEDKGVLSMYDRLKSNAEKYFSAYQKEAAVQTQSYKEQILLIKEKIRQQELENRGFYSSAKIESREKYLDDLSKTKSKSGRARIRREFQGISEDISGTFQENKLVTDLLKQLLEEQKKQTLANKATNLTLDEQWDARKSLWTQELRENREGVEKNIKSGKKNNYEGLSQAQKEKLQYQEYLIQNSGSQNREKPSPSFLQQLVSSALLQQTFSAFRQGAVNVVGARDENALTPELYGAGIRLGGYGMAGGTRTAGKFLAKAVAGKAADALGVESIANTFAQLQVATAEIAASIVSTAVSRNLSALKEKDIANNTLYALTGKRGFAATEFGYTTAQTAVIEGQFARAGGTANNIEQRTRRNLGFEFGYQVDRGEMTSGEALSRFTQRSSSQMVADVIQTLKTKGIIRGNDFSKLNENVNLVFSFLNQQSNSLNNPNSRVAAGIVGEFRKLGGPFSDQRLNNLLPQFNQALSNPSDDYNRALNFGVISKLRGGKGSYLDFIKDEAKGLEKKGFFGETLKQIEKMSGGGLENTTLGIMKRFDFLKPEQAETLAKMFQQDRSRFDDWEGSKGDIDALLEGRPQATDVVKSQALIEEAYTTDAMTGFKKALELNIDKFKDKISSDVLDAILDAFDTTTSKTSQTPVKPKKNTIPFNKMTPEQKNAFRKSVSSGGE
jgi:hypothetical protein